jgi:DNA polymerase
MTLRDLLNDWRSCDRCGLSATRHQVVFGSPWSIGARTASDPLVLILGEAPGQNEDARGEAFVGASGKILREDILTPAGIRVGFITNCLGCRPPGNRDPLPDELAACLPRLVALANALQPDLVVSVGRFAKAAVETGGRGFLAPGTPHVSIVHPSALLRKGYPNEATRKTVALAVAKIKVALSKLRPTVSAESDLAVAECDHSWIRIGSWREPLGTTRPMVACAKCAALSDSGTPEP